MLLEIYIIIHFIFENKVEEWEASRFLGSVSNLQFERKKLEVGILLYLKNSISSYSDILFLRKKA